MCIRDSAKRRPRHSEATAETESGPPATLSRSECGRGFRPTNSPHSEFRLTFRRSRVPCLLFFIRSMANTRSAAKRARQTQARMLRNRRVLTGIKSQQKKLTAVVAAGDEKQAALELAALSSRLDKASRRGIIHRNSANRKKSRASKKLVIAKAPKAAAE